MKSLLDIQQDVRELEDSVKEIADRVKTICSDIEDLRNTDQDPAIDYAKIEILAKQMTFGGHPLQQLADERVCRIYLEMLLLIVRLDGAAEATINRLVFLQWLQIQSGIDLSLEELYEDCHKINGDSYYEYVDAIPAEYRDCFLVDGLVIAGMAGAMNREAAEYIADLGVVFGLEKEKLRCLFLVSRMVLSQSVKGIDRGGLYKVFQYVKDFGHYLGEDVIEQGLTALREVVVKIHEDAVWGFEWQVKDYQMVEEGDVIATCKKLRKLYWEALSSPVKESNNTQFLAPCSGKLFRFISKKKRYGIIAHETDRKDAIKKWVESMEKDEKE